VTRAELVERRTILIAQAAAQRAEMRSLFGVGQRSVHRVRQIAGACRLIKLSPALIRDLGVFFRQSAVQRLARLPQLLASGWTILLVARRLSQ
jgi:hypothetical protein